jgi:hypothetical protein
MPRCGVAKSQVGEGQERIADLGNCISSHDILKFEEVFIESHSRVPRRDFFLLNVYDT